MCVALPTVHVRDTAQHVLHVVPHDQGSPVHVRQQRSLTPGDGEEWRAPLYPVQSLQVRCGQDSVGLLADAQGRDAAASAYELAQVLSQLVTDFLRSDRRQHRLEEVAQGRAPQRSVHGAGLDLVPGVEVFGRLETCTGCVDAQQPGKYPAITGRVDDRRRPTVASIGFLRSEEHTSELQSQSNLVCRLLLEKKKYS